MKPAFPSPTPTWHNDIYPAIDPTNPNLSHAGQTIIVTGAVSLLSVLEISQFKSSSVF
jgi:hypothetical protein